MIRFLFFLLFIMNIYSSAIVKINIISEEFQDMTFIDRKNTCEKRSLFEGKHTDYFYINNQEWTQIYSVKQDEELEFLVGDGGLNGIIETKKYIAVVTFNVFIGTKVFLYDIQDMSLNIILKDKDNFLSSLKTKTSNYLFKYINNRDIYAYVFNKIYSFKREFDYLSKISNSHNMIKLEKDDVLEIEVLNNAEIKKYRDIIMNKNYLSYILPNNYYNKAIYYDKDTKSLNSNQFNSLSSYDDVFLISDDNKYMFRFARGGVGLEILLDNKRIKNHNIEFSNQRYLYHIIQSNGNLNFNFFPGFDRNEFLNSYINKYLFPDTSFARSNYAYGNYYLKLNTGRFKESYILCKVVDSKGIEKIFVVNDSFSKIKIPQSGKMFVKAVNIEDGQNLQLGISKDINPVLISNFMHDIFIYLFDIYNGIAKSVYIAFSQDTTMIFLFKIIMIGVVSIYLIMQDFSSLSYTMFRFTVICLIVFNIKYATLICDYSGKLILGFVDLIFHGFFNTVKTRPFMMFDLVFEKLIMPFSFVFIAQLVTGVFLLFVISFLFSFFTQTFWSMIIQSFILPLEVYIGIIQVGFLFSFMPILLVLFLLFDFTKDLPLVFIKYLFHNIIIKIISLFVFMVYIEFIISFILSIFGSDIVTCYDNMGVPSVEGASFDFWTIILLYSMSLIIMPTIQSLQKELSKIFN